MRVALGLINLSRLRGKLFSRLTSHHSGGIRHRTDDVGSHTQLDRDSHIMRLVITSSKCTHIHPLKTILGRSRSKQQKEQTKQMTSTPIHRVTSPTSMIFRIQRPELLFPDACSLCFVRIYRSVVLHPERKFLVFGQSLS